MNTSLLWVDISSIQPAAVSLLCSCSGSLGGRGVAAGLCVFVLVVAQKKEREHPQNAADGHADGFTLQEKKNSCLHAKSHLSSKSFDK